VREWGVELVGRPDRFRSSGAGGGVIQDSASSATLCALVAARERSLAAGARLDDLAVYASNPAHSALADGGRVAGLRPDQVRSLAVDDDFALRPDALVAALVEDRAAGRVPCLVMATVGTTSSLAVDPVAAVAAPAVAGGAWVHVDAAMGRHAPVCPAHRG